MIKRPKVLYTRWLDKLNQALNRPDKTDLIVLAWFPWSGKTEFTHFVARANADLGIKVAYLSLEMPKLDLAKRYGIKRAWVRYIDWQEWNYTDEQAQIIKKEEQWFLNYPNIKIEWEKKRYTLSELIGDYPDGKERGILDFLYHEWYRMFIIDNLGKIGWFQNETMGQAEITDRLDLRKNKLQVPVILLHHMSKPDKRDKPHKPGGMAWIRGSQKIIDNASQIIEVFRDQDPDNTDMESKAKVEVLQYKNRMAGTNGFAEIYFRTWTYHEEYDWPKSPPKEKTKKKKDDWILDVPVDDLPF